MNRKRLILFCVLISFVSFIYAQSSDKKPEWARSDYHVDLKNSYLETIVVSSETTTDAMRQKAKEILTERRSLTTGERVVFSDGETQSQSGLTVYSKPIGEYIDYEKEIGYFLFQTLKKPSYKYENVGFSDEYPFSPRVFVPGMAQLYKGSTTKGVLFIVGHAVCIGGIVACEGLRTSYQSKINTTHDVQDKQNYINNADNMQNLRNGFIAGTALLYAWNVIDGIVAKGKPHVVIQKDKYLSIVPYIAPQPGSMAGGVSLSFNF